MLDNKKGLYMFKLASILACSLLYSLQANASIERWFKASQNASWVFEFKNKTTEPVYIQLLLNKQRKNYASTMAVSGTPLTAIIPVSPTLDPWDTKSFIEMDWYDKINPNTYVGPAKGKSEADAGYLRMSNFFDSKQEYILLIWTKNKADLINTYDQPTYAYVIKPNKERKRIFLTWENNKLRSQSGTGIISKTSSSGVSLDGNIKEKDIISSARKRWRLTSQEEIKNGQIKAES